ASGAPMEGGADVVVTARLDAPAPEGGTTVTLTAGGTATDGVDYRLSSKTITIAQGKTTGTATLTVVDDTLAEGSETVVIGATADAPELSAESVTLAIVDDEQPTVKAGSVTAAGPSDGIPSWLGSDGNDFIVDGLSAHFISGVGGNDTLQGGGGDDTLVGGMGDDVLSGGEGYDTLRGNSGIDTADYSLDESWRESGVFVDLTVGLSYRDGVADGRGQYHEDYLYEIENVVGTRFADRLHGSDSVNKLEGRGGNDTLWAGRGRDMLLGGAGDDILWGARGHDTLSGGEDDDLLIGGRGRDKLTGGEGEDIFVFAAGDGRDIVEDFVDGVDKIRFVGLGREFSFADLEIVDEGGGDAVVSYGNDVIVLRGVSPSVLDEQDFEFFQSISESYETNALLLY
ncbi:MAG: calcium-binding protein, partial [Deltaproteobacteria bacterium]|nr:calcium-binding protein [Deltaproteobacteria bacterium]